jgi:hypothetical protein
MAERRERGGLGVVVDRRKVTLPIYIYTCNIVRNNRREKRKRKNLFFDQTGEEKKFCFPILFLYIALRYDYYIFFSSERSRSLYRSR